MTPPPRAAGGTRRTVAPETPPSARTGPRASFVSAAQRTGPSGRAPGWLRVANSGDTNAALAPARLARTRSGASWAELVTGCPGRSHPRRHGRAALPPRRCSPAPTAAASRGSLATVIRMPRCRHRRAAAAASAARPGTPSWRNTTPQPRGSRAMAGKGSGSRTASVNSHKAGSPFAALPPTALPLRVLLRALTWRAQAASLLSMQPSDPAGPAADTLLGRLAQVQARIAAAAARAGRPAGSVQLVAVSKTYPAADVLAVVAAGQLVFGENRVQEAAAKFGPLRAGHPGLQLHLIGGLQTNKARDAVRTADVIESLDRPRLADAIADALAKDGVKEGAAPGPRLLVQVNVGDEPQKAGIPTQDADGFIEACRRRFGPLLTGLMCIPPADGDPAPHFAWLAACAARHGLGTLSMGMSGDYEAAIAQGATHVRVGSAIFGARPPLAQPLPP